MNIEYTFEALSSYAKFKHKFVYQNLVSSIVYVLFVYMLGALPSIFKVLDSFINTKNCFTT